jgi:hypothetical protein
MMTIAEAQRDIRLAYYGGATGLFASATAWLAASVAAVISTPGVAILTLLVGGMLIFPVSVLLSKTLGRSGAHSKINPLGPLALESTFWMLLGIPVAYAASLFRVEWFFPAMLLTIGGRYLTFATLYGMRIYWACGATLALVAFLLVVTRAPVVAGALAGALIEYGFGAVVLLQERNRAVHQGTPADPPRPAGSAGG